MTEKLDILAIAAHRDDAEQTCGGTLLKMAKLGLRTGILDLTQGEMGTRGSAEERAREAEAAASILKVGWRRALELPDGGVENTLENRLKIASVIRETRPRVVILPYHKGRHPDHYTCAVLGYEACFIAGLTRMDLETGKPISSGQVEPPPHRPFKIIYASLYFDVRPTFVVDITEEFEERLRSILAYHSQYSDQQSGSKDFPAHAEIQGRVEAMARYYGLLAGVKYAEPFTQNEIGLVEDIARIPVQSI